MIRLILFILVTISFTTYGHNNTNSLNLFDKEKHNQDSNEYIQKSVEFIKQVKGGELLNSTFILADRPFSFKYFNCFKELLADTLTYSKEELTLVEQMKYLSISYWTKELFPDIKLTSSDTLDIIFKDRSKGWTYFFKNIGHNLNNFSAPIFLRNYTYCLFYSDNSCGGRCGSGKLTLYKRIDNRWIEVKSYCSWIS